MILKKRISILSISICLSLFSSSAEKVNANDAASHLNGHVGKLQRSRILESKIPIMTEAPSASDKSSKYNSENSTKSPAFQGDFSTEKSNSAPAKGTKIMSQKSSEHHHGHSKSPKGISGSLDNSKKSSKSPKNSTKADKISEAIEKVKKFTDPNPGDTSASNLTKAPKSEVESAETTRKKAKEIVDKVQKWSSAKKPKSRAPGLPNEETLEIEDWAQAWVEKRVKRKNNRKQTKTRQPSGVKSKEMKSPRTISEGSNPSSSPSTFGSFSETVGAKSTKTKSPKTIPSSSPSTSASFSSTVGVKSMKTKSLKTISKSSNPSSSPSTSGSFPVTKPNDLD